MDELDHKLLQLLQRDSRLPVASLAAEINVSRATVKSRIDRLLKTGVIEGFTTKMGAEFRGSAVRALVQIEIHGKMAERVGKELLRIPEVRALHSTNGRWDYIAELETRDLQAFDTVLRRIRLIDGISLTESNLLLSTQRAKPF